MKSQHLYSLKKHHGYLILLIAAIPFISASTFFVDTPPTTPAPIYISSLGSGSSLTSPIQLEGWVLCQEDQLIRIELVDIKNRVLARTLAYKECNEEGKIPISENIYFDASAVPLPARITFSSQGENNFTAALTTVEVSLTQFFEQINAPQPDRSAIIIDSVQKIPLKEGFNISISGWVSPFNTSPLIFEVYTPIGLYIGSKQHIISSEIIDGYALFQVEIPTINDPGTADVVLIIRQMESDIPGNILLQSFPITLEP